MRNKFLILALHRLLAEPTLNWYEDYDDSDLNDALDHINLMRNRQMEKGFSDLEFIKIEKLGSRNILPSSSFKGKPFGWLKNTPKEKWVEEFKKVHNRDISYILEIEEGEGLSLPIVIDGELADGYGRVLLAYALGEYPPVAYFKGIVEDE